MPVCTDSLGCETDFDSKYSRLDKQIILSEQQWARFRVSAWPESPSSDRLGSEQNP